MRWGERIVDLLLVAGAARGALLLFWYLSRSHGVARHHIESTLFITAAMAVMALAVKPADRRPQRQDDSLPILPLAAVLLVVALVLYWPVLGLGWLSDDWVLADWSRRGEFVGATHEFVRPLPLILWGAILAAGGGAVATHALNLALHVVNALLTGLVARQLHAAKHVAIVSSVVFLVWPTQVEVVAWASAIFDALCTAFLLLAVWSYRRFAEAASLRRAVGVLACAVAAMLSKESALALPLLLTVVSLPRWAATRPRREEMALFSMLTVFTAAYGVWRVLVRPSAIAAAQVSGGRYALKEILSRPFGTLAMPFDADWIAAHPLAVFAAACIPLSLVVLNIVLARRRSETQRLIVQGSAWAICVVLPSIGYAFIGPFLQGSRYVFAAAVGWSWILAASAWTDGRPLRRLAPKALLAVAIGLALIQAQRLIGDWRHAAELRDAVVRSAADLAARDGCSELRLAAPIPEYRGTQLFRNGFELAVRDAYLATAPGPKCDVVWNGNRIERK